MTRKSSVELSLKRSEMVRGYEIRRLPLGEYLTAIEVMRRMPQELMRACFPEEDAGSALDALKTADIAALTQLIIRAMQVVPLEAVSILCAFTGIDQSVLLNDPDIGLDGAAEMLEAAWRLNGIENFTRAAGRMAAQVKALKAGFSG